MERTRSISLDTETTGFKFADGHRIVSIGCVEMVNGIRTGEVFHVNINPERDVPYEAYRVHGLSTEFLRDKPVFADVADDFLAFIGDSLLVIHNAAFDFPFLNFELERCGRRPMANDVFDTLVEARRRFPGAKANLDALCKRFKIDNTKRLKHGALIDADLLAQVYLELIGGSALSLSLDAGPAPEEAREEALVAAEARWPRRPAVAPTEEEARRHGEFVATVKNSIWMS